jgi:mannitol/fructose-specific phosphotransferase system IIA component (Ntr-type)
MLLTDYLTAENIKIPVTSVNKEDLIMELIEVVSEKIKDPYTAYKAVLEREKIMTTGIGHAVAIPHCKDESCPEFVIALGISHNGINFGAIDNSDVKIIFLLLGPVDEPHKHIKLLSRISRLMGNEPIREKILRCRKAEEALYMITEEEKSYPLS